MSVCQQAKRRRTAARQQRLGFKGGRVPTRTKPKSILGGFSKAAKTAQK